VIVDPSLAHAHSCRDPELGIPTGCAPIAFGTSPCSNQRLNDGSSGMWNIPVSNWRLGSPPVRRMERQHVPNAPGPERWRPSFVSWNIRMFQQRAVAAIGTVDTEAMFDFTFLYYADSLVGAD
jgi:hypothetical protein